MSFLRRFFCWFFSDPTFGLDLSLLEGRMVWVELSPIDFVFVKVIEVKGKEARIWNLKIDEEIPVTWIIPRGLDSPRLAHIREWLEWMPSRHYMVNP